MDVLMPQLGETVAEGKITKWYKSAGDAVKPGDNLFEIETDKVSMEVPSTATGVLAEIRVGAGEVAPVGAIVAVIAGEGSPVVSPQAIATGTAPKVTAAPAHVPAAPAAAASAARVPSAPVKLDPFFEVRTPERNHGPARLAGGAYVTPLARRLASESRIDLARVAGSGPHGRIVASDIQGAIAVGGLAAPAATPFTGLIADQIKSIYHDRPFEEVALDGMRATIAKRLVQAKQTIPHFYLTADVEIGRLLALREEANAAAPKGEDGKPAFKLSVNDFIIKAWAAALQRVPAANAAWAEDRILRLRHSDIAIAVAVEGGLITPIVREAETKSLSAISTEMRDLAARGRERRLYPHEYQGGSSSISNLGMHGVREFAAIINPPQATILAVGAARRQGVEKEDGGVAFASMMTVTLSCDHRVVDGALGAELLTAFKGYVENPVTALL